jgi:endonuclease YncB( thermonuclease family)
VDFVSGTTLLSEIEVTYFRSRIDDVLREGRPTTWQRQFLMDMRQRIERYGTRTRLSEKQMSTLRKLTKLPGQADLSFIKPLAANRGSQNYRPPHWRRAGRRHWSYSEIKFFALLLMMIAVFGGQTLTGWLPKSDLGSFQTATPPDNFATQSFTVTDGDTVRMSDGTRVRLVGFNTPEKFEPQCSREAALGARASERLRELVASGTPTVTRIACSCKPGTEGTDKCNHGRRCGTLRIDGRDVGDILISEGLAVPFVCGDTSCPATPRPWCG